MSFITWGRYFIKQELIKCWSALHKAPKNTNTRHSNGQAFALFGHGG